MNNKLFVGNLSWDAGDEDLRELFSKYGTVTDVAVLKERDTGRSRGFGFVTMETDEEAQACIDALNESEYMGRDMVVNVAKPMERRERNDRY